jgi:WD domain, G-beta repeat
VLRPSPNFSRIRFSGQRVVDQVAGGKGRPEAVRVGMLATASWDGTARLWALPAGLPCSQPFRHELVANSVAFSPDGKFLATGSFDKTARLWRVPALIRDLHEMELRTWLALGARFNAQGIVEAIPWGEWQELRKELRGLEQAGAPDLLPDAEGRPLRTPPGLKRAVAMIVIPPATGSGPLDRARGTGLVELLFAKPLLKRGCGIAARRS